MGGSIDVKSKVNEGTNFYINLSVRAIDKKIFLHDN